MIKTLQQALKMDREKFKVPRSVQQAIPIQRIWPDGVFQSGTKFSKTFRFSDINYAIASKEDKTEMFLDYSELLNALDSGAAAKITLNNRQINKEEFEASLLLPMKEDGLDEYRKEYNEMLLSKVSGTNNSIYQERYLTVSVHKKNIDEARTYFARVGTDIITHLSKLSSIGEKEKALRIARKVARETAERRDKQNVRGEKSNIKKGVPRIVLNALQGKSEKSTSKLTGVHQEKAEKLTNERNQLRGSLSPTAALKTDFNSSSLHTGKILVTAKEINFSYHSNSVNNDILTNNEINSSDTGYLPNPNTNDIQENSISKQQLWQAPVSFQLKSGDRFRIEGANGSGKTTLLKLITGQLQPQEGTLTRTDFSYVYLNQEYSIIDDRNSILEQAYAFNSRNLPEHEIKIILNRYLFPASEWDKSCRKLSGGEKMRLAFCCLMISNNTPDMFILDEPTNNLDIQSIEIITATIKNYAGTVIAISHDNYFIQEIGVEQCILLS